MLEIKGNDFILNKEKFNIYSGAVHYFRFMPEYWEEILTKLKLCGLNTVETYVCWNLHEKKEGEFDFSGSLDIAKFIKTAQKLGLYCIVRSGPYICAEWDFGGLPAWLLKDRNMRVRCMYEPYIDAVKRYYKALFSEIAPLQLANGGNIIAMQIENEYGSYGNDKNYLAFLRDYMRECGCTEFLFTSDGPEDNMLSGGMLDGTLAVVNFGSRVGQAFDKLREFQPTGPLMCGEFWNGWFDRWDEKEKHHQRSADEVAYELKEFLKRDASFNFYMFCGGTNFGFTSGANCGEEYQPTVTGYDYDALLTEWGGYTEKYHKVRKILLEHQGLESKELPPEPELQNIGKVKLTQYAGFLDNLENIGTKVQSVTAESMEYFGQNSGLILYHHTLKGTYSGKLYLENLGDRAHIFINKELKGTIYRNEKEHSISIGNLKGENELDILVEDMGRVNYGAFMLDRKGVSAIRINLQYLSNFDIYLLPLDNLEKLDFIAPKREAPVFMKGRFEAQKNKSCFVHLSGFSKGYVFVNGFNLGRYWRIGPQKSLYLPGALLNDGENEIVVLELDKSISDSVSLRSMHDIGQKKKKGIFG